MKSLELILLLIHCMPKKMKNAILYSQEENRGSFLIFWLPGVDSSDNLLGLSLKIPDSSRL